MELPTTKQPIVVTNPKMLLIYGPPKVGKTTALSELESCLTIDTEDGSDYVEAVKVKINSLVELRQVAEAIKAKNKPYKYIALDSVTKLEEWCEGQATANYRASVVGSSFKGKSVLELANGGGYLWLRNAFTEAVYSLYGLAPHLILIGHVRDKMLGNVIGAKTNAEVSAKDLDLTGKCKQILCSRADAIGYVYRVAGQDRLNISFSTSEEVNCGSRCGHLKGKVMPLEWNKIFLS